MKTLLRRYLTTLAYAAHDKDARRQRQAADAALRKAEEALVKLHARKTAPTMSSAGRLEDVHYTVAVCRYLATPAYAAHDKDARRQRQTADAARRKAEEALVKLHARQTAPMAAPDGAAGAGTGAQQGAAAAAAAGEADINPFLRRPLWEEQPEPAGAG